MNQSTSASVANLQLHHNFRWVLCSPHTEPVRGFLSRYLRRRLISTELQTGMRDAHLERVVSWLPAVLDRVNKFLENQCSSELTIGMLHAFILHTQSPTGSYSMLVLLITDDSTNSTCATSVLLISTN